MARLRRNQGQALLALTLAAAWAAAAMVHAFLVPPSSSPLRPPASSRRGRPLYMIDNFFRLHEKNRQLQWDDFFGKARYDLPQAFGSAAVPVAGQGGMEAAVDEALRRALGQLPACASLDLAVVSARCQEEAALDAALAHLSKVLPGETRVIGWGGPGVGAAVGPTADGEGAEVVGGTEAAAAAVSITLGSTPAVDGRGFFVGEDELRAWREQDAGKPVVAGDPRQQLLQQQGAEGGGDEAAAAAAPVRFMGDKKWELRVGVSLNEAYKDPPVFLLLGNLRDPALAATVLQGLDVTYPGTAKIGGLVSPDGAAQTVLFSREGGAKAAQGARILKEDTASPGVLGLALVGDIRALTFVSQGVVPLTGAAHAPPAYRVEAVSADGRAITRLAPLGGGAALAPKDVPGITAEGLALGLGEDQPDTADAEKKQAAGADALEDEGDVEIEGADRWSLVSVRGSKQAAAVVPAGRWAVDDADGSIRLEGRTARPGQYLSWYRRDEAAVAAHEQALVEALSAEIEEEWAKPELGVMKFRPTGTVVVKGANYPSRGLATELGRSLATALPTAPIAGMEAAGGQWAPLDPARTSALLSEALVVNVLACKAKRRDLREIRFDFRAAKSEAGKKGGPLDLPFDVDAPLRDAATGEVAVNRQAALIGTDVRVDNMAWNVREERVLPTGLYESMVWTKERELHFVREEAPLLNVMRTVMTMVKNPDPAVQAKAAGLDVVAALQAKAKENGGWAVLGEVMRGSPFHGVAAPTYGPVQAARAVMEHAGAGAVAVQVDQTYYGGKYQHVREVKDALREAKVPVVASDLTLYPYQLYLAKLFGADGVKMAPAVLSDEDLQYQVKICQSLMLTPVITAASLPQLRRAAALPLNQTSILVIEDRDQGTMRPHSSTSAGHPAADWLRDPEVQASLRARGDGSLGTGGAPLVLVAGPPVEKEAERETLRALGVAGALVAYVDLPPAVIRQAAMEAARAGGDGAKGTAGVVDAAKLGALFG